VSTTPEAKKGSWRDTIAVHQACEKMPAMTPDELRTLGEDIRQNGLRSPIVLFIPGCYDDDDEPSAAVLLDGKNRLDALEAAGFTPRFTQDVDPRLADRDIVTSLDLDAAPSGRSSTCMNGMVANAWTPGRSSGRSPSMSRQSRPSVSRRRNRSGPRIR
jgi:hypothetical protein